MFPDLPKDRENYLQSIGTLVIRLVAQRNTTGYGYTYTVSIGDRVRLITGDPNHTASHLASLGVSNASKVVEEAQTSRVICVEKMGCRPDPLRPKFAS